jgi:hypothetical protein
LAACLIAALGLSTAHASQESHAPTPSHPHLAKAPAAHSSVPAQPAASHQVTTCADDGSPGSLRAVITDWSVVSGDTIDLSTLACSRISLDGNWLLPEIPVYVDDLTLKGPAAGAANLVIDAGHYSRVLRHFGLGTLSVIDLTITNGYYMSDISPVGGCVVSYGNLSLTRSTISNCTVVAGTANVDVSGGGVYAHNDLTLVSSTITNSHAIGDSFPATGGGAYVRGNLSLLYSSITDNSGYVLNTNTASVAGGIFVLGNATIQGSTISGNAADRAGGIEMFGNTLHTGKIINSTISNNTAAIQYGGIWTNSPLTLADSTVAFNKATRFADGAGLHSYSTQLTLQSSIIADNVGKGEQRDVGGAMGASITATSAKNLITSSSLPPPQDTLSDCPRLEPLADNGGGMLTHALHHTGAASPAIDVGFNAGGLVSDQRLLTRSFGLEVDIGSVEWHPSDQDERILTSGLDGFCDS